MPSQAQGPAPPSRSHSSCGFSDDQSWLGGYSWRDRRGAWRDLIARQLPRDGGCGGGGAGVGGTGRSSALWGSSARPLGLSPRAFLPLPCWPRWEEPSDSVVSESVMTVFQGHVEGDKYFSLFYSPAWALGE